MPSYSWLPPWSLPNAFIQKQRVRPGFDATAQVYAQRVGISLSSGGSGSSSGGSSRGVVVNSEEFLKFQAERHEFVYQQINLYSHYLKRDPCQGEILYNKEKASTG